MATKNPTPNAERTIEADSGAEQFKDTLLSLVNDLLDRYYNAYPGRNAFGADYDGPSEEEGDYYLGRSNGADGAENAVGVDYIMRSYIDPDSDRPREEEKEYIFGDYGWMDVGELAVETEYFRAVFEQAVEIGIIEEETLSAYDAAVEQFQQDLREYREAHTLADIADLFQSHDEEALQALLGHGEEERRIVWQLLNSHVDGDLRDNPIEVPVISEEDRLMLVRAVRTFEDDTEMKEYPYAAVVGYDDTPERFFAHRLSSDSEIQDPETEWTADMVKNKMGFDRNLWETDGQFPHDTTVRVQGDLAITRRDYDDALAQYADHLAGQKRERLAKDHIESFHENHSEYAEADDLSVSERFLKFRTLVSDTDALKDLQDELGIAEETVRAMQDERDYSRLTAKRRAEIIEDLCQHRAEEWGLEQEGRTAEDVQAEAREEAVEAFTDTPKQFNGVFGNHPVISTGVTAHPNRRLDVDDNDAEVLVAPDDATVLLAHDEHDSHQLSPEQGVLWISFLDGYQDQWWM